MNILQNKIELALAEIRPFLQADGGDIELVEILNNKVIKIRLLGSCTSCSINQLTLKSGVELTIKKYAPEVEQIINIV